MTKLLTAGEDPYDKSSWGPGPWQDEPDRVEWEHLGLPCLIVRSDSSGSLCGYAAVPPGHPLHGKDYNEVDLSAHGGLTYCGTCRGDICHVPKPGEPDDVWWFGFDTAHFMDVMPKMEALLRTLDSRRKDNEAKILDVWKESDGVFGFPQSSYKTIDYVTNEVNRLAEQLVVLA